MQSNSSLVLMNIILSFLFARTEVAVKINDHFLPSQIKLFATSLRLMLKSHFHKMMPHCKFVEFVAKKIGISACPGGLLAKNALAFYKKASILLKTLLIVTNGPLRNGTFPDELK